MTSSTCRRLPAALCLLPLLSCGKPTYRADRLEEHVQDICRREYNFDATARLVGKTLYASIAPQRLVGTDLGLDRKTVERLYDALLTVTRVALSTDAQVDFLIVKAKDANMGVTVTLLRYVPDIKWYFYMRISRTDFENRGIMEIDSEAKDDPAAWRDVTMQEFMARLVASRLQQKISANPLVSVLVRVHRVKGAFQDGVLAVRLDKVEQLELGARGEASDELLRLAVVEGAGDVVDKYDDKKEVRRVRVLEEGGHALLDLSREELLAERKKLPKKKPWEEE